MSFGCALYVIEGYILRKNELVLKIKKLRPEAVIPVYAHGADSDSGFDLRAIEPAVLRPLEPTLVKTGLSIELPPGFEAQIRPRSGLALKNGITVLNSPGTVDPAYRGEIGVILMWTGFWAGNDLSQPPTRQICRGVNAPGSGAEILIQEGDRIAQMCVTRYERVEFEVVEELADSVRGEGGFGSSGVR
jgi:dUTP pyrophosphatase